MSKPELTSTWSSLLTPFRRYAVGVSVLTFLAFRMTFLAHRPDRLLITTIPDDAFYYLQIALSRIQFGHFSFDLTSKTSGFHLLFAYFLAFLYWLLPSPQYRELWLITGVIACVLFAVAAEILADALTETFTDSRQRLICRLAIVVVFISPLIAMLSTSLMESVFVVPICALTFAVLIRQRGAGRNRWLCAVLGLIGVVARTDFIVLPAAWAAISVANRYRGKRVSVLPSLSAFGGAVFGELAVLVHSFVLTGHATQMSAAIKFHWSQLSGNSALPALSLLARTLLPSGLIELGPLWIAAIGLGFCAIVAIITVVRLISRERATGAHPPACDRPPIYVIAAVICAGYLIIYRLDSAAIQFWYAANFVAPFAVLLSGAFAVIYRTAGRLATGAVLVAYLGSSVGGVIWDPWKNQPQSYNAAMTLRQLRIPGKIGAWNAGIMNYFSGRGLVNLDGLVNDQAAMYVLGDCLACFVARNNIAFIVDYDMMFSAGVARTHGFGDGKLANCTTRIRYLDDETVVNAKARLGGSRISLFGVDDDCLKAEL
jgi:hypothetical protein